ncbi:Uroporphyrinogen-III C-methyltransferase [Candidatus Johnevansia muelleri]|uniref:uroporphyrinogen-III C-methyltransferase n=1 Tax=Candidatus Johnevansia muelleri TaxID=1495769 RepID=A0A078KAY1_9GAMM|nr:Uroporphyrinogen-III C-methyltransferase [Candidatus Evansia muelleri]
MDIIKIEYKARFLDNHLIGGGYHALALANHFACKCIRICLHYKYVIPALLLIIERERWELTNLPPNIINLGQLWLIATGNINEDLYWSSIAIKAGIIFFSTAYPVFSSIKNIFFKTKAKVQFNVLRHGHVSLIGAGPGDPGLLTIKALEHIYKAEILIYDRLVSSEILALVNFEAKKIYVGKSCSQHSISQENINKTIVNWAKAGYYVVRLKGGDSFIFGRGGEELENLVIQGISFDVIPGITAAIGVAAYTGIALTHRDYAKSVLFINGNLKNDSIDWYKLISEQQTLVFYMGFSNIYTICTQLILYGMSQNTPIALIEQGTTAQQIVHIGTINNFYKTIAGFNVISPTIIIIGKVVHLHNNLKFFYKNYAHSKIFIH